MWQRFMRVVMGLCTTPQWNLDTCVFRQCGAEAVDAFFFHPRAEHSVIVASGCAVRWNSRHCSGFPEHLLLGNLRH